jgi:hypothetical protein
MDGKPHAVEVSRAGHSPWRGQVTLKEEPDRTRLELTAPPLDPLPAARPRWPRWAAAAATALSAAGFVWQAVEAEAAEKRFNDACGPAASVSCDAFRSDLIDSERARGRRDILGLTTLATGALFAYLVWAD